MGVGFGDSEELLGFEVWGVRGLGIQTPWIAGLSRSLNRRSQLLSGFRGTIGASVISNTILGAPCYSYSIMGPKTLF